MPDEIEEAAAKWGEVLTGEKAATPLDSRFAALEKRLDALESYFGSPYGTTVHYSTSHTLYSRIQNPQPPVPKEHRHINQQWCECGHTMNDHGYIGQKMFRKPEYGLCGICPCDKFKEEPWTN
jgi:hypothetical protein